MKRKIFTLMFLSLLAFNVMAQFKCINWVNMANEPDYADVPYEKQTYEAVPTPKDWSFNASTLNFDAAWAVAGKEVKNSKPVNISGGDLYDLGNGDTYGSSWKAMYDANNLYILLKWVGTDIADAGTANLEFMFQPTSIDRYEADFTAAEGDKVKQNHAYARYVELGGGKGVFADGMVSAVQASSGDGTKWSSNDHALTELALVTHYWKMKGTTINAVLVMPLSALSYPTDPTTVPVDLETRTPFKVIPGETKISWDLKDNIKKETKSIQYAWNSDKNNVYAVNYYAGYLLFGKGTSSAVAPQLKCINWVNMAGEPDYAAVPYVKETYKAIPTPKDWTFNASTLNFDAAWAVAGKEVKNSKPVNISGGDLYDLGSGDTYGSSWKAMYDANNLYILLKWVGADKADAGTANLEFMFQPTSIDRFELDFAAAAGDKVLQNHSYARYVELGGGKGVFAEGMVSAVQASSGDGTKWSSNDHALTELALVSHYWKMNGSTINAVLVMPLSALSYPTDPTAIPVDLEARTPFKVIPGETKISWDLKDNIKKDTKSVQYAWNSDKNNVYAVDYYAGYLLFESGSTSVSALNNKNISVFYANEMIQIRGVEKTDIQVYNLSGQLVKSAKNISGELNIGNLQNGIYIVRLSMDSMGYKVTKF
jgi:hypothetical protein